MLGKFLSVSLCAFVTLSIALPVATAQDPPADPELVDRLVDELGSDSWQIREKASESLGQLGPGILDRLRQRLASTSDEEVRMRLEALVAKAEAILLAERVDAERALNRAFYEKNRERLRIECAGKWFVIAEGTLFGPAADFESALSMARDRTAKSAHRYVFKAGSETREGAEPEVHGSLRSGDVGPGVGCIDNYAFVDGKPFMVVPGKGLVPIPPARYSAPENKPDVEPPSVEIPVFINTGFPGQVCLDPAAASRLGLHRFEIPGEVEGGTLDSGERPGEMLLYPARRAWVSVKFGHMTSPRLCEAWLPRTAEKK